MRFRRVPGQIADEVPKGSGTKTFQDLPSCWGSHMSLFLLPRRRAGLSERWGIFVDCNPLHDSNAGSGRDTLRCSYLGELNLGGVGSGRG